MEYALIPAHLITGADTSAYAPEKRRWQGIPSLERTPGGRLFSIFYSGSDGEKNGNFAAVMMSEDDGASWQDPFMVIVPEVLEETRVFDPNLWLDPLGRLWVTWTQSHGFFDGRLGVWASLCENPDAPAEALSFTPPRRIANGVMMNKPTVLKNGSWLFPCAIWDTQKCVEWSIKATEDHPELSGEIRSNVYITRDRGASFSLLGGADTADRQIDEHMVVENTDGTLCMYVRAHKGVCRARSEDGGITWTDEGLCLPGPCSRFFIRRLQSGRLLLVNHDSRAGRSRLTAYLSEDDGNTWTGGLMLDERSDVSYPDGTQAPDGRIYIVHDHDRYHDRAVLMSVFTEADILAGRPVSGVCRFLVPVSRALAPLEAR